MDERHMAIITGGSGNNNLAGGTKYAMQGTRRQPLSDKLLPVLATAAVAAGVDDIRVVSGGQPRKGTGGARVGSVRHDDGGAGDIQLVVDGRTLDFDDPNDRPVFEKFLSTAVAAGAQGIGAAADYMGTKTIHVGFGAPGAWGKKGKTANAPAWVTAALNAGLANPIPVDPNAVVAFEQGRDYTNDPFGVTASKAPQDAQSAIASLMAPSGGPSVPEPPTAAMGFAPTLPQMASFDGPTPAPAPPPAPPMPQPPPQWAQAGGFPMDEALTGRSADQVLMGGPRMDPRRSPPGTGPMPPDMGAMRSPADVLNAGPNLDPRRVSPASAPIGPTTAQGVLDMGPNLRPSNVPDPRPRPERGAGIPDPRMRPDPASLPQRGFPAAFGEQPQPLMGGMSAAMGDAPSRTGDLSAAMGGPPSRAGDLSAAMGGPPAPPDPFADFGTRDLASELQGQRNIADANYYRPQNIMQPPSPPMPATMGERFDMASAQPNAAQMFGLPDMNGAAFPGPDPVVGTAAAGSTTGEFFTPAPPMPQPAPDPMAGQFDDAFSPAAPGMIADLQGAFNRQQQPPQPATAQDGINSVFGAPPAAAMPPNLAIPFNEVPGFMGAAPAEAATPAMPSMGMGAFNDRFSPAMPAPQPISMGEFDQRFAGGTVAPGGPPPPGTPGVVQGTMPGPMDIRSPAQGGAQPAAALAIPAPPPTPAPRQTNVGAERQRSGTIGRILGGLLGGPVGALGGGLLGGGGGMFGGGGGFGFGGQPTYAWSGGGTTPGGVSYKTGTSNAAGGSNAMSWQNSKGNGTVTVVQDPWTGTYYGPSYGP
jgi:hypothetical protein